MDFSKQNYTIFDVLIWQEVGKFKKSLFFRHLRVKVGFIVIISSRLINVENCCTLLLLIVIDAVLFLSLFVIPPVTQPL